MTRTARRVVNVVAGTALAGLVLVASIGVGGVGPAGRPAGAPGAGTLVAIASTPDLGGSYPAGRRWS